MSAKWNLVLLAITLLLIAVVIWLVMGGALRVGAVLVEYRIGQNDFVGYWAQALLLRTALPPYDPELVAAVESSQGWSFKQPQVAMYPPWIFVLFLPFTYLSLANASVIWLCFSALIYILSIIFLNYHLFKNKSSYLLYLFILLLYFPFIAELLVGNISILMLAGLCLFLMLQEKHLDYGASCAGVAWPVNPSS